MTTLSPSPLTTVASKTNTLLEGKLAKLALGGVVLSIPIGFVAYKHVSWMETPRAKKRMALHQATFWSGMAACVTLLHSGAFWEKLPLTSISVTGPMRVLIGFAGGMLGAFAFKGGLLFSNKIFPKEKDPSNDKTRLTVPAAPFSRTA